MLSRDRRFVPIPYGIQQIVFERALSGRRQRPRRSTSGSENGFGKGDALGMGKGLSFVPQPGKGKRKKGNGTQSGGKGSPDDDGGDGDAGDDGLHDDPAGSPRAWADSSNFKDDSEWNFLDELDMVEEMYLPCPTLRKIPL